MVERVQLHPQDMGTEGWTRQFQTQYDRTSSLYDFGDGYTWQVVVQPVAFDDRFECNDNILASFVLGS